MWLGFLNISVALRVEKLLALLNLTFSTVKVYFGSIICFRRQKGFQLNYVLDSVYYKI